MTIKKIIGKEITTLSGCVGTKEERNVGEECSTMGMRETVNEVWQGVKKKKKKGTGIRS